MQASTRQASSTGMLGSPAVSELAPPEGMLGMFGGPQGFASSGRNWVAYFREVCELEPDESVLDVGCGAGRVAVALTDYLTGGTYEGLDVAAERVRWCQENITPRWPSFRFQVADVLNRASNPDGGGRGSDYRFPYEDASFGFAWLISVFTHMLPDDVEQYLGELRRVLRPGGRLLITWELLNEESLRLLDQGKARQELPVDRGDYRCKSEEVPERLVAYREEFVRELYEKVGLELDQIRYGRWSGREVEPGQFMGQDVVLARRPE